MYESPGCPISAEQRSGGQRWHHGEGGVREARWRNRRAGLEREGDDEELSDELLGMMAERLQSGRPRHRYGEAWQRLEGERGFLTEKLEAGLRLTKVHSLLAWRGVVVPYRTLHRFCAAELELGGQRKTVPV